MNIETLVVTLAKAILRFSNDPIRDFETQMTSLFSIFRGDKTEVLESDSFQGYLKIDSSVNDGFIHENDDGTLIELGINFSESSIEEKFQIMRNGVTDKIGQILDGEAVLIFIHSDSDRVHVATDPFGLFPLFFHRDESSITISTDLMGVLLVNPSERKKLSNQSIIEFVSCHFIMENRTLFENVSRLAEGSLIEFDRSKNSMTTSEWYAIPQNHEEREMEYWISEVSKKLVSSMKKRVTPDSGLFLSGGMDSRVVLASIPEKLRMQVKAITFGVEGADDCRIAKKVAERFNVDLHHLILDIDIFKRNFLIHVWMSAGISNHMVSPIATAVSLLNVNRIFDGFAGDAQFGGGFHNQTIDIENGTWPGNPSMYILDKVIEKGYIRPLAEVSELFEDLSPDDFGPIIQKGIVGELARFDEGFKPTIIFEMILFRMRVRGNTLGAQMSADAICPVMKPYYDMAFANTIMRIPPSVRRKHQFYNIFLRKTLPATLKDSTTTILPFERIPKLIRFCKRVLRFLARKVGVSLFPKRGWIPIDDWIRNNPEYRDWMKEILLSERTKARGILSQEGIKELLRQEIIEGKNLAMTLVNAVDLELILRLYSDGDGYKLFAEADHEKI
jgi:asparagine synthase (glutamine-hydrolysing)